MRATKYERKWMRFGQSRVELCEKSASLGPLLRALISLEGEPKREIIRVGMPDSANLEWNGRAIAVVRRASPRTDYTGAQRLE